MKVTLHLVRGDAEPAMTPGDWLVRVEPLEVLAGPQPGPIDHDRLVELVIAAARVIVW